MTNEAMTAARPAAAGDFATDRSLPIALLRAREKVMGPIRGMLSDIGLTEQQWRVLRLLDEIGPADATEIAERACLLPPSLSRIVQTLVEKDYVTRSASPTDRRRQMLALTKEGRRLLGDNMDEARRIAEHFEARFGRKRLRALLDLLNELDRIDL